VLGQSDIEVIRLDGKQGRNYEKAPNREPTKG